MGSTIRIAGRGHWVYHQTLLRVCLTTLFLTTSTTAIGCAAYFEGQDSEHLSIESLTAKVIPAKLTPNAPDPLQLRPALADEVRQLWHKTPKRLRHRLTDNIGPTTLFDSTRLLGTGVHAYVSRLDLRIQIAPAVLDHPLGALVVVHEITHLFRFALGPTWVFVRETVAPNLCHRTEESVAYGAVYDFVRARVPLHTVYGSLSDIVHASATSVVDQDTFKQVSDHLLETALDAHSMPRNAFIQKYLGLHQRRLDSLARVLLRDVRCCLSVLGL